MTGRNLLIALSLLLVLAPVRALATELKAQSSPSVLGPTIPFWTRHQGDLLRYMFASGDPGNCMQNGWYATQLFYGSNEESATVS